MADQEFLASFGVDIDESGVSRLQQILTENKSLGAELAASFNAAAEGVKAFKESVSTDLPSLFGNGYGNVTENMFGAAGGLKIGLNMTEPKKEIAGFTAEAKKEIPLAANASGIVSAARTALENVRSLFSETFTINVRASTNTDDGDGKKDSLERQPEPGRYRVGVFADVLRRKVFEADLGASGGRRGRGIYYPGKEGEPGPATAAAAAGRTESGGQGESH